MSDILAIERATRTVQGAKHAVELQSIRGIAALVVVLHHCTFYYRYDASVKYGFELLLNAHAAVVSFFVLSGFVLTLSLKNSSLDFGNVFRFYLRRGFRIYPALWLCCIVGLCYTISFYRVPLPAMVHPWWLAERRTVEFSAPAALWTLLGLKTPLAIPMWTLCIELVGSALIPYFAWCIRKGGVMVCCLLAGLLILSQLQSYVIGTSRFFIDFALGGAITLFVPFLRNRLQPPMLAALGLASFLLLWFGRIPFNAEFLVNYHAPLPALLEGVGAMGLIAAVYAAPDRFPLLRQRWATWLGDISYSLYLIHMPILGVVAGVGGEILKVPLFTGDPLIATFALMAFTSGISLVAAAISYRFLEIPAIELGKRVVARIPFLREERLKQNS